MDKTRFADICAKHQLDDPMAKEHIAQLAHVPLSVVDLMLIGARVERDKAVKVLGAVSLHTGQTWTLDNVSVPLVDEKKPSFADVCQLPGQMLNVAALWMHTGVHFTVVDAMLAGHPVKRTDAIKVLANLSRQTKRAYTFEDVEIPLLEDGEQDASTSNDANASHEESV
jgi:hypothetical protein